MSSQNPNQVNVSAVGQGGVQLNPGSINLNTSGAAILINNIPHQIGGNIQIPNSLVNSANVQVTGGSGVPNTSTTTFILNPSTTGVQNIQPTAQIINTSQINQMIASSPLISQQPTQQQQPLQTVQQQQQQQSLPVQTPMQQQQTLHVQPQFQIKQDDHPSMSNGTQSMPLVSASSGTNGFPTANVNNGPSQTNINKPNGAEDVKSNVSVVSANSNQNISNGKSTNAQSSNNDIPMQVDQPKKNLHPVVVLDKQRLQELVQEVDPNEQLEEEVEDVLLTIADDFIESLVSSSCMIARHRKSNTLDVKDVQLALEKNWNMWIPGFGVEGVVGVFSGTALGQNSGGPLSANRPPKKCLATEAHKQRLALIKKTLKKF